MDEITYKKASEAATLATRSAILGPFFRTDHPIREKGDTISFNTPDDADIVYMHGRVLDAVTKKPLPNATLDVWEASTNGKSKSLVKTICEINVAMKVYMSSKMIIRSTVTCVGSS